MASTNAPFTTSLLDERTHSVSFLVQHLCGFIVEEAVAYRQHLSKCKLDTPRATLVTSAKTVRTDYVAVVQWLGLAYFGVKVTKYNGQVPLFSWQALL